MVIIQRKLIVNDKEIIKQQEYIIVSLKDEIRLLRKEIAGLREERRKLFDQDNPPGYGSFND